MDKELEKRLKKQASTLLNCFGFVNAKPTDLVLKDYSQRNGIYDYILVKLEDKFYQFSYDNELEGQRWQLLDVTEYV